ncbi:MAG: hypothetical protein ACJAW3_000939 [Lentimonas sp.]|jgi:hypothetical protein
MEFKKVNEKSLKSAQFGVQKKIFTSYFQGFEKELFFHDR